MHTAQPQPIIGTPADVPVPRNISLNPPRVASIPTG